MNQDIQDAMSIIKKACASVVADLPNHQAIQSAIAIIEAALYQPEELALEEKLMPKTKKTKK